MDHVIIKSLELKPPHVIFVQALFYLWISFHSSLKFLQFMKRVCAIISCVEKEDKEYA